MTARLVIAGGGPAGSAAAITAARGGERVLLLERSRQPVEGVCGCFLSADTVAMLAALGVDPAPMGASRIERVRLVRGRRVAQAALPFVAHGLSRHRLDTALLEAARDAGAEIKRGVTVASVRSEGGSLAALAREGREFAGRAIFLATGKHELRGWERRAIPAGNVAMKQMFRLAADQTRALDGAIELHLFNGGYCGLQLAEHGIANLCLVVSGDVFRAAGSRWDALIGSITNAAPLLAERLDGAEAPAARPVAVAHIPYGHIHRPGAADHPSIFRLGDQAAVIPSFAGDGLAIALWSGSMAAQCLLGGQSATRYHQNVRRGLSAQFRVAGTLDRLLASSIGRAVLVGAGAAAPSLVGWAARRTRLDAEARQESASAVHC